MKNYILISGLFHLFLFGGFIAFKYSSDTPEKSIINQEIQKNIEQDDISTPYINEEKEAIMNAISISEEELNLEIDKIVKIQKDKELEEKQKYELLEQSLEYRKRELEREQLSIQENLLNEKASIEKEKQNLINFQNEIKEEKNTLSEKEKEIDKLKKEMEIKLKNSANYLNENNHINKQSEKKLKLKQIKIIDQNNQINEMNKKIIELENNLKQEYIKKIIKKTVVSSKKEENNILKEKSKEEIELLKKEAIEYNLMVKDRISNNWKFESKFSGVSCNIQIFQSNDGNILSVKAKKCNASNEFIASIKEATWKASPLPLPKKDILFSKQVDLYFTYN